MTMEGRMSEYIYGTDGHEGHWLTGEEIVRCRDCKRYHPKEGKMFSCKFEYGEFAQWRSAEPDGFCAWGERRDA